MDDFDEPDGGGLPWNDLILFTADGLGATRGIS